MELRKLLQPRVLIAICGFISHCISLKLPSNLSQDMVCVGCEGVMTELHKRLVKASKDYMEVRVIDAMDGICTNENFKVYDYIPPKMVRACKYIIDQFDEELENSLISYFRPPIGTLEILMTKICHNMTKFCEGHDKEAEKNKKEESFTMMVDGEEKQVPIKYGSGADEEEKKEGGEEKPAADGEGAAEEGGEADGEGAAEGTRPDERSEPDDEESELRVEDHDEL